MLLQVFVKVVSKQQQLRIQWRLWKPFNSFCSMEVTNQENPFSFQSLLLSPPPRQPASLPQTDSAHSHTGCHLRAWITSFGDYLAHIKKLTVLSLFMFGQQTEFTQTDALEVVWCSLEIGCQGHPRNYSPEFIWQQLTRYEPGRVVRVARLLY